MRRVLGKRKDRLVYLHFPLTLEEQAADLWHVSACPSFTEKPEIMIHPQGTKVSGKTDARGTVSLSCLLLVQTCLLLPTMAWCLLEGKRNITNLCILY